MKARTSTSTRTASPCDEYRPVSRGCGPDALSLHGFDRLGSASRAHRLRWTDWSDLVLAGISSVIRGSAIATDLVVDASHPEFKLTGLRVASVLRLHKLAAVEVAVVQRRLGRVGPQLQANVDRILRQVLGL